jgi:plastocyanin
MTWRWLIFFSIVLLPALLSAGASGGVVNGAVEITNSHEPAVRRNKDYSGVVIWLEPVDKTEAPRPTPKRVQMVQKDRHFNPHVLAVAVGSTVDFPNRDPYFHNAFSNFSGQTFDIGLYAPGTSRGKLFKDPGIVRVFCNIHPTMSAIIAVLPNDWYMLTDSSGKFSIPNVPAGDYQLRIFYERALPENLRFLERRINVPATGLTLPLISISETGYIPPPHLNKYGKPYSPLPNDGTYPGAPK